MYCIGISFTNFSQTTTFTDNVTFSTSGQSMWGSGAGFTLDKEIPLIPVTNFGSSTPTTLGGTEIIDVPFVGELEFGAQVKIGAWGNVGSKFYIKDVSGGTIDVDYPIANSITYPAVNTINRGEWVTIETDYVVRNGWKLQTGFPSVGSMGLDFDFGFGIIFEPKICAFGCLPVPTINEFIPLHIDIFKVSASEIIYPGATASYSPGCPPPGLGYCSSPIPCPGPIQCWPTLIKKTVLPITFDNGIGLSATLDLPNVSTNDNLEINKCLTASGSYQYFETNLDVLKFMGSYIPPPAGTVVGNLSNTFDIDPFILSYTLLSANFNVTNTTFQDFEFCPQIKNNFHFSTPVFYEEVSPFGLVLFSGQGEDIIITSGNNLRIKYPCNYEFMPVTLDYDLTNQFSNHTYDELASSFILEALGFSIGMSAVNVWSSFTVDPCFGLFGGCSFTVPGLSIPGFVLEPTPNPLLSFPIPIATIAYDWFPIAGASGTWELEGFTNKPGSSFTLDAMPYLATSSGLNIDCYGDNTGVMDIDITNGVAPFDFYWSDGSSSTSLTQLGSNSSLISGTNSVVIEDVNGCQVTTSQLISEPIEELHTYNVVINNVDCNGNATGNINLSVIGGTAPYTYVWFPIVSNSNSAIDLAAGTYSVEITDSKNCSYIENYTVTEPTILNSSVIINQHVSCNGGMDGSATIFSSGGSYPYTYAWSTGDNSQTVSNLPVGNHSCMVTDVNNCTITVAIVIEEPLQVIQLSITENPVTCYGQNNGSINLTTIGGTAPYQFDWYNGGSLLLSQHVEDPVNLLSDTYLVNVTDDKGCIDTISVKVTEPNDLLISTLDITDVLCNGNATGEIDISVGGGTGPYNFLWSNGDVAEDLTNVIAGTYTLDITDANLCELQVVYEVIEPEFPLSAISVNNDVLCFGDNTGGIDLTVSGGTGAYSYLWNTAEILEDIDNLLSGNYSTVVTDENGCTLNFNTSVEQPNAPLAISYLVSNVTCFDSINGSIMANISGGTTPYYYQWNTSSQIILSDTTNNPSNLVDGIYSLTLIDTNNCVLNQNIPVTQPDSITLTSNVVDVLCKNELTGEIDLSVSGGPLNYTYLWSNGDLLEDLNNVAAGDYTVVVTDGNGCENSLLASIVEPEGVLITEISKVDILCFGENTGIANASVTGGVAPYSIVWSNTDITFTTNNLIAGVYTSIVTDDNGCISNSGTLINQPPTSIGFGTLVTDASCYNFLDGDVTLTPIGGTAPYTLVFGDTLNNTFNNLNNSYSISNLHSGTYYARVIDEFGCEYEELIPVGEPDSLTVMGVVTDALCYGSSDGIVDLTVVGGTNPYNFLWNNATGNQNLTGVTAGWYSVEVTDAQNCLTKGVFLIGQPDEIMISGSISQTTCRDNEDGSITIFVEGGVPDYTYLWSTSEVTESVYNLAPGMYIIEVMDEHGCIKNDTFNLNQSLIDCIQPPTAFTPDGDAINDTWILENINNYENAVVKIFNKWGNLLYETNGNYIPWNGYYNGKRLPSATYYYIINLNNTDVPYTGPITIVINE
jgi:gliding motility-associated-like protein